MQNNGYSLNLVKKKKGFYVLYVHTHTHTHTHTHLCMQKKLIASRQVT